MNRSSRGLIEIYGGQVASRGMVLRIFPRARGKEGGATRDAIRSRIRTCKDRRAEALDSNLLKIPTSFDKLLQSKFSYFAKF